MMDDENESGHAGCPSPHCFKHGTKEEFAQLCKGAMAALGGLLITLIHNLSPEFVCALLRQVADRIQSAAERTKDGWDTAEYESCTQEDFGFRFEAPNEAPLN